MHSFFYTFKHKPVHILNYLNASYSKSRQTHYDILNLPRTCTSKEIKESFIKLSKENHPDVNKNKDAHKKFLAINESYKVLSNLESRRNYDLGLITDNRTVRSGPQVYTRTNGAWNDPSFYTNRNKEQDDFFERKPYYGIKGQKRISNLKVLTICICLAVVLVSLQFLAITKSVTFQREELLKRSQEAQDSLNLLKKAVNENGNEIQMEILKLKLGERNNSDKKCDTKK